MISRKSNFYYGLDMRYIYIYSFKKKIIIYGRRVFYGFILNVKFLLNGLKFQTIFYLNNIIHVIVLK